jgi:hypothetical protein
MAEKWKCKLNSIKKICATIELLFCRVVLFCRHNTTHHDLKFSARISTFFETSLVL